MDFDHGFAVLYRLRLKGRAEAARIAAATGSDTASVQQVLEDLSERGLAVHRGGRVNGWLLTPQGRRECGEEVARRRGDFDAEVLTKLYDERFLALNGEFKALCVQSQEALAHHDTVLSRLEEVHRDASQLVQQFAVRLPWFPTAYSARLEAALARFRGGDRAALVQPFTDSYHDVWMELHEELLLLLDRRRADED